MKSIMTGSAPTSSSIFMTLLLVASLGVEISGKRGCSSFGHSCYGGHGKRSYPETLEFDVVRNKDDTQMDYDVLGSSQRSSILGPRIPNLIVDRPASNSWALFIRKLLVPLRRPYIVSSEEQK